MKTQFLKLVATSIFSLILTSPAMAEWRLLGNLSSIEKKFSLNTECEYRLASTEESPGVRWLVTRTNCYNKDCSSTELGAMIQTYDLYAFQSAANIETAINSTDPLEGLSLTFYRDGFPVYKSRAVISWTVKNQQIGRMTKSIDVNPSKVNLWYRGCTGMVGGAQPSF